MEIGDYKYWFNVIINNRKPRIGSVPNDFALYQMPKGEFVVGSMTIVPSLDIVMNKEDDLALAAKRI